MHLAVDRVRFLFEATEAITFQPWQAANALRGALGRTLPPERFSPRQTGGGPSGFKELPRPFVLRAAHLNGRTLAGGQRFTVDVHVFDGDVESLADAFQRAAPLRSRCLGTLVTEHMLVSLEPPAKPTSRVSIRFLSPTELKRGGKLATQPDFSALFARAISRVRHLSSRFSTPSTVDHVGLEQYANEVQLVSSAITWEKLTRTSQRTGQTHPLGGFRGEATYEGPLQHLIPWLRAAEWTGVGRHTVWGKGQIEVSDRSRNDAV